MCVQTRREVPRRARRDPAAERGELERLREVAQREAVLAERRLERRTGRAAPIRAERETGSSSSRPSSAARSIEIAPFWPGPTSGVTPPTTRGSAPVGDRGDVLGRAPLEQALDVRLVARVRDEVRRALEAAAEAAHDVQIGLAEGVRGARVIVGRADVARARPGSRRAAPRAARRSSATGCSGSPSAMPSRSASAGTAARACSALGCWSSRPHPQCLRRALFTRASLCSPGRAPL